MTSVRTKASPSDSPLPLLLVLGHHVGGRPICCVSAEDKVKFWPVLGPGGGGLECLCRHRVAHFGWVSRPVAQPEEFRGQDSPWEGGQLIRIHSGEPLDAGTPRAGTDEAGSFVSSCHALLQLPSWGWLGLEARSPEPTIFSLLGRVSENGELLECDCFFRTGSAGWA